MHTPTEQKERPGVGTEAFEDLAGELSENNSTKQFGKIRISEKAEAYLDNLVMDLAVGNVELWQLPRSLSAFYWFAWFDGNAVATSPEIDRLNYECDRLYRAAFHKPFVPTNRLTFAELEAFRESMYSGVTR